MLVSKVTFCRGNVPCVSFVQPSPRPGDQMQALLLQSVRIWWVVSIPAEPVAYEAGC